MNSYLVEEKNRRTVKLKKIFDAEVYPKLEKKAVMFWVSSGRYEIMTPNGERYNYFPESDRVTNLNKSESYDEGRNWLIKNL